MRSGFVSFQRSEKISLVGTGSCKLFTFHAIDRAPKKWASVKLIKFEDTAHPAKVSSFAHLSDSLLSTSVKVKVIGRQSLKEG